MESEKEKDGQAEGTSVIQERLNWMLSSIGFLRDCQWDQQLQEEEVLHA
jgi:hypothetical protein